MRVNTLKKFFRVAIVTLSIALVLFLVSLQVWGNYQAAVGYESLAASIAILSIVSLVLHQHGDNPTAPILLISGFAYYATIELGGAIEKLWFSASPLLQKTPIILASDLIELANLGAVIIIALFVHNKGIISTQKRKYSFLSILYLAPLLLNGLFRLAVLQETSLDTTILIGFIAGIVSIILLTGAGLTMYRFESMFPLNGPVRLTLACFILAMSSTPSMISLFAPGIIWTFTIILQLTAFFLIFLALGPTFLGKYGIQKNRSLFYILIIMFLIAIPFFSTLLAESLRPEVEYINTGAYLVSTIGATSMSAALAIIIFTYAKKTVNRYLFPVVFVYSFLSAVGLTNMLLTPFFSETQGESISSLVLVTFSSIPALALAIKWMTNASPTESRYKPEAWILIGFIGGIVILFIGIVGQNIISTSNQSIYESNLGECLVLALNSITFGEFIYFAFLIIAKEHGQITVETLSVSFLILWILQNTLKAIFPIWTAGWWLGEILLLMGLLGGPAILGYLFLGVYLQAQSSGMQAKVFSDVLAHDISNLHQAILYALELARMKITPEDLREKSLDEALYALADADRLAKNVRTLGQIEVFEYEDFQTMNLISTINSAFKRLTQVMRSEYLSLNFINPEFECFILANELLEHIFLNLFHNALSYSEKKQIDVKVSSITIEKTNYWEIKVIDYGPGIPYSQRHMLFERYMKGSKGSGLGLSVVKALTELFRGTVRIEDRIKDDYAQGTVFVLTFPVHEPPIIQ